MGTAWPSLRSRASANPGVPERRGTQKGSPETNVEESLTGFVKRVQKRNLNGREITVYKEQLSRISTAIIRMAMVMDDRAFQLDSKAVTTSFDMLLTKDEHQRVLWPATLHLNQDYFATLQQHAVPLDELARGGLAHSVMALDIYAWLAQRLTGYCANSLSSSHGPRSRTSSDPDLAGWIISKPLSVSLWSKSYYPAAKVEGDSHGLTLYNSPPPVKKIPSPGSERQPIIQQFPQTSVRRNPCAQPSGYRKLSTATLWDKLIDTAS